MVRSILTNTALFLITIVAGYWLAVFIMLALPFITGDQPTFLNVEGLGIWLLTESVLLWLVFVHRRRTRPTV